VAGSPPLAPDDDVLAPLELEALAPPLAEPPPDVPPLVDAPLPEPPPEVEPPLVELPPEVEPAPELTAAGILR
jgi:hypothetical protein